MNIERINELGRIIEDAKQKMDKIETMLLTTEFAEKKDEDYLFNMFYMNMDRRSLAQTEITKIKSNGRV